MRVSQDMHPALADESEASQTLREARMMVEQFLEKSMIPDPDAAAEFLAPDAIIHFTGATRMHHPRDMAAYNARRYNWVKKKLGPTDACFSDDQVVVYSFGTLYGEWPDGEEFSGNRYVDRFVVRDGKIVQIDVLNDSAERIINRSQASGQASPAVGA